MNAILQNQYGSKVVQDLGDNNNTVPAQQTTMQAIVQKLIERALQGGNSFLGLAQLQLRIAEHSKGGGHLRVKVRGTVGQRFRIFELAQA